MNRLLLNRLLKIGAFSIAIFIGVLVGSFVSVEVVGESVFDYYLLFAFYLSMPFFVFIAILYSIFNASAFSFISAGFIPGATLSLAFIYPQIGASSFFWGIICAVCLVPVLKKIKSIRSKIK